MSTDKVRLRYDGPALADHSIDVSDLAPALLALADICKIANRKFNGERASVKVLVNADLDQNCFEVWLQLAQTLLEQTKSIIANDNVATAKEIFEWLGIVGAATGAPLGLLKLLALLRGRKVASQQMVVHEGRDVVQIKIEGDNNVVNIRPEVYQLLQDPKVVQGVQRIVKPLAQEGFESVEFDHGASAVERIDKQEAAEILGIDLDQPLTPQEDDLRQTVTAWIRVYSPVYEKSAKTWRFEYGDRHEYMDISSTDIAERAIERGGALVNDTYKVRLEISQTKTASGSFKNHYKVVEVLEFRPAKLQSQERLLPDD